MGDFDRVVSFSGGKIVEDNESSYGKTTYYDLRYKSLNGKRYDDETFTDLNTAIEKCDRIPGYVVVDTIKGEIVHVGTLVAAEVALIPGNPIELVNREIYTTLLATKPSEILSGHYFVDSLFKDQNRIRIKDKDGNRIGYIINE